MKYHFIIRGRNCEPYIEQCIMSLMAQTKDNWRAHVILDAPEDDSYGALVRMCGPTGNKLCILNNINERRGLARNIYEYPMHILCSKAEDEDVLCFLDADDWLSSTALHYVDNAYKENPGCLLTYGSYIKCSKNRRTKVSKPYPPGVPVRKYPWRGSHLKTVKWKLFKQLPEHCMKDNQGNWLEAASDLAIMIPLMEMAGHERMVHIHPTIYFWRDNTPHKTKRAAQIKCEAIIRSKPRMERAQVT